MTIRGGCLLEVCLDTPAGLMAALAGGAERIELCSALALSGLTPAPGLMHLAARQSVPSYAMIRPRPGDFCFSPAEIDVMRVDIDAVRAAGLPGVVLGASRPTGELDADALGRLVEHANGLGLTLHRAFDVAPDLPAALETAIGLGFERVLTSGGERSAIAGADRLRDLVCQAGGRISIMAGSGVTASNVRALVDETGVREVHGAFSRTRTAPAGPERLQALGFVVEQVETDQAAVAAARAALDL
jgi:copper homeostasis protein